MLKITKTYEDFNGVERTEDFFFNFSKSELMNQQTSVEGGMIGLLTNLIRKNEGNKLTEYFREFVLLAYGEKSDDGRIFLKNDQIKERFKCHAAFSDIYMDLVEDPKKANDFFRGVFPAGLSDDFKIEDVQNMSHEEIVKKIEEVVENNK